MAAPARSLEEMIAEVVETTVRRVVREELAARPSGVRREVLSKRAAAAMLGIDRGKTLAALIADGQIRTTEIRGRACVLREDVERVIAGGAPTAAAPSRKKPGTAGGAAALRALTLDDL